MAWNILHQTQKKIQILKTYVYLLIQKLNFRFKHRGKKKDYYNGREKLLVNLLSLHSHNKLIMISLLDDRSEDLREIIFCLNPSS